MKIFFDEFVKGEHSAAVWIIVALVIILILVVQWGFTLFKKVTQDKMDMFTNVLDQKITNLTSSVDRLNEGLERTDRNHRDDTRSIYEDMKRYNEAHNREMKELFDLIHQSIDGIGEEFDKFKERQSNHETRIKILEIKS